jgi:bifunctional DNA-binding transcriptional regulator/antitoxin component of YhaV-PrlF toxin-antitoxin module
MARQVTVKGQVTIPKRVREAGRSSKRSRLSRFAAIRGTATVKLRTEEILALTRGKD